MTQFDEREKAFENKFVHEQNLEFKANMRRNWLIGRWAAEKLGYQDEAADDYARKVIAADFAEAGDEDVFRKIREDFAERGIGISDHRLRREMDQKLEQARREIMTGAAVP